MLITHFICTILDHKSSIGQSQRTVDICSTGEIAAVPYEVVRFELQRKNRPNCSLSINIPERSWIRLETTSYSISCCTTFSSQCQSSEQVNYVEIKYLGLPSRYHRGFSRVPEVLFTTYSSISSQVLVNSVSLGQSIAGNFLLNLFSRCYYQLRYTGEKTSMVAYMLLDESISECRITITFHIHNQSVHISNVRITSSLQKKYFCFIFIFVCTAIDKYDFQWRELCFPEEM